MNEVIPKVGKESEVQSLESEKDNKVTMQSKHSVVSIKNKILVGSIVLILLLGISVAVSVIEMSKIEKSASSVITVRQPITVRFLKFSDNLNLATTLLNGHLLTGHADDKINFQELEKHLRSEMEDINKLAVSETIKIDQVEIDYFQEKMHRFYKYAEALFDLRSHELKNYPGLLLASKTLMPAANSYLASVNELIDEVIDLPVSEKNYRVMGLLSELRFSWQKIMNSIRLFFNSRDKGNLDNIELYLELNKKQLEKLKSIAPNIGFGVLEDMESNSEQWRNNWRKVTLHYLSDTWRADSHLMETEVRPLVEDLRTVLLGFSQLQLEGSKRDGVNLTESVANVRVYSGILLIASFILCIVLAIAVSRAIIPPIRNLLAAAQSVASGDLNAVVPVSRMDEVGELSMTFNNMVNDMRHAGDDKLKYLQEIEDLNKDLELRVEEKVAELKSTQGQLLQSDKLASIGQLAAGVAHEINNPVGYINSNVGTLKKYTNDLFRVLEAYEKLDSQIEDKSMIEEISAIKGEVEFGYLKQDISELIAESQEGVTRVKQIVEDLKDFSHVDEAVWQWSDLHNGINSTLNVAHNEIKYKAEVIKEYGDLPQVQCMPSQLNQVFMNLVVNAAHAIEERGYITIRSGQDGDNVWISISDDGKGMSEEVQKHIFEPFFTTKPVGKGTGLGLSLSYGIIEKHSGQLTVESEEGVGTTFKIVLPIEQEGSAIDSNNGVESAA